MKRAELRPSIHISDPARRTARRWCGLSCAAGAATIAGACALMMPGVPGVTVGGQQDIAAARRAIEDGEIPDPQSITVEGFLSEHSIPIEAPATERLLFGTASVAWEQDFDAFTPLATLQVGLGTTLDREALERPDLNLCLVIDRSGSMAEAIDVRSGATKLDAVKIAVDRILAQLTDSDRVSVVAFNSESSVLVEGVVGSDLGAVKTALDPVVAEGGTELAAGLRRGFGAALRQRSAQRSDRLVVFTDALLQSSAERQVRDLLEVMELYATDNLGTTLFGVGTDFGHDIVYDISQIRGGNYFFLGDYDRIVSVLDTEFDYLVTPIAYDVMLRVDVPVEFDVTEVYGVPFEGTIPRPLKLTLPTLFLSAREGGGAILVRIRPGAAVDFSQENTLATLDMTYETPVGETEAIPTWSAKLPAGLSANPETPYFETPATQRAVLLLNTALVLKRACEDVFDYYGYYYAYDLSARSRAMTRLQEFLPFFDALAAGLEDQVSPSSRTLSQERALVVRLLANVQALPH